jgi:hypothetical protein
MKNSEKTTCGEHGGVSKQSGEPCERVEGWGTDFDTGKCKQHRGTSPDGESHTNNDNAQTHGLHTSAETFFENADQHHLDTYYAVHEALCSRFEQAHGREPMFHDKKELAQVALSIAKLDMADEYAAENAVDPAKPLTENEQQLTEQGVWEKEVVSKIETLKTDIRRENRLLLKDKGIYASPESQQADASKEQAELVRKALQED